jgi:hypothetical protein
MAGGPIRGNDAGEGGLHMVEELLERNSLISMPQPPWKYWKDQISGYTSMTKHYLDQGWRGNLMTFISNQLRGDERQINHQIQYQIEGTYASFLTRLNRRPRAYGAINPILIACPDWPVAKYEKKSLREILTNDGLHYHGLLLLPPATSTSRLKVSAQQHFVDQQSYYVRDQILNRIHVQPFETEDVFDVTDYALKGLKTNRLPAEETLLILPKSNREIRTRPYLTADAE